MLTEFTQVENSGQILTFLYAILFGGILCMIYDIYRSFIINLAPIRVIGHLLDILYFLFASVACFCFLLVECQGQIRFYAILGFAIGFYAVRKLCSKGLRKFFSLIITFFAKTIRTIINPIRRFINWCYSTICNLLRKTRKIKKLFSKKKEKNLANDVPIDV